MSHTLIYEHQRDTFIWDSSNGNIKVRFGRDEDEGPINVELRDNEIRMLCAFVDKIRILEAHTPCKI